MELQYRGSGKVYYDEREYGCDLYYNSKEGGIILKIRVKHEKGFGDFLKLPLEISYICGQLETGFLFTLVNLNRYETRDEVSFGITVYTFAADYIFCGVGGNTQKEQTFHIVNYTLTNIMEWGESSVYAIGENYELIKNKDYKEISIFENTEFSIRYSVIGTLLPITEHDLFKENIELKQNGTIIIESQKEVTIQKFNEIFNKFISLIELSMLRKINVEKVIAFSKNVLYSIGNAKSEQAVEIYGKNIKQLQNNENNNRIKWKWISISELINNNSINLYFDKQEKLAPIIELFLEPLKSEESSNTRVFLNIVQALETYHSRFVTNSLKKYKKRIEDIIKDQPNDNKEKYRKFLIAKSTEYITLESRIADLLVSEWRIIFDTGDINYWEFPSVVAQSRNYYIHYEEWIKRNQRVLSSEELRYYNRSLLKILEYYILLELGFPTNTTTFIEKLNNRWGNISQDLEIIKISRNQNNNDSNQKNGEITR